MTLTQDSVFLYNNIDIKNISNFLEIGCDGAELIRDLSFGNGKIQFYGIDIKDLPDSEGNLHLISSNISAYSDIFFSHYFDLIISNPPYYKQNAVKRSPDDIKNAERTDVSLDLELLFKAIKYLLKPSGRFYFTYPCVRLYEVLKGFDENNLKPVNLIFRYFKQADIVLFCGKNKKGAIDPKIHCIRGG